MAKIIEFQNIEDKRKDERIQELRKQLHGVAWDLFPIIDELNELAGLELVLVDKEGIWYQHNEKSAKLYKDKHKDELEKIEKPK